MINIGIIRKSKLLHGITAESYLNCPKDVNYKLIDHSPNPLIEKILLFKPKDNIDLYQTMEFVPNTEKNWLIYFCDVAASACFDMMNHYPNRKLRIQIFKNIVKKSNCKQLIFASKIGKSTLKTYAKIKDKNIIKKSTIIYPGIREFNFKKKKSDDINILFVGPDFYRKGGEFVVNAFLKLQKQYDNIKLNIFSRIKENPHHPTKNHNKILATIKKNKNIVYNNLIPREHLLKHYPKADIFIMPTLKDNFGFALLEAQAFGLPTISTNHFAVPEIIQNNKSGFLVDINKNINDSIYKSLKKLIENNSLRNKMSKKAIKNTRKRFSIKSYNKKIKSVYEKCLRK